jgi:hypothetical protein
MDFIILSFTSANTNKPGMYFSVPDLIRRAIKFTRRIIMKEGSCPDDSLVRKNSSLAG